MDSQTDKQTIESRLDKLSRRFYDAQDTLDAAKEEYEKVFSELQDLVEELLEGK